MATKSQFNFEVIKTAGQNAIVIKDLGGRTSVKSDIPQVLEYLKALYGVKFRDHLIIFSHKGLWHQYNQKSFRVVDLNYLSWGLALKHLTTSTQKVN